jgi:hypothetical protein
MTHEVKRFSAGVMSNGGAIQQIQEREAKREREHNERLKKEAEDKHLSEATAKRNKDREERAIEQAERNRARQAIEDEKQKQIIEKFARAEEERQKAIAIKEAARLVRQQDLERKLAEKKAIDDGQQAAAEVAIQLALQRKIDSQNKAKRLLDDLSEVQSTSTIESTRELIEPERTEDAVRGKDIEGPEEHLLQATKGEVHVPISMPATQEKTATAAAYDLDELLPAPVELTAQALPETAVHVESGKELIDRILQTNAKAPEDEEKLTQTSRSENRFQKIANANRELKTENETLKEKLEKLLDVVHSYEVEGELIGSLLNISKPVKVEETQQEREARYTNPNKFSIENEAKKEMLKYLSSRQGEVDHIDKSNLFLKYMQDPFYMNVFVKTNKSASWWAVIDTIYNAIELPPPDWSKVKPIQYNAQAENQTQPIRARTATLGIPVTRQGQPMDRIAQHLGNMGI